MGKGNEQGLVALVRQAIFTVLDKASPRTPGIAWDFNDDEQRVDFADQVVAWLGTTARSEIGALEAEQKLLLETKFTREDAAKIVERKAAALAEEYCHGDAGPGGYTWTNKEAEWQAILLDELAEEFRNAQKA